MAERRATAPWVLIPIYDHGATIGRIVGGLERYDLPCLIVDDGSGAETRAVLDELARRHARLRIERLPANAGKGAALRRGFQIAFDAGATHVIHLDADGQHEIADVARFADAVAAEPEALILGQPIFDETVPRARLLFRQLSRAIVWFCTLSFAIADPLCGFRAVPLAAALAALKDERLGDHMQFEPGLAVVLYWAGIPVRNLPTHVRYLPGGVSHFDAVRDTMRMAGLYTRLVARTVPRIPYLLRRARTA